MICAAIHANVERVAAAAVDPDELVFYTLLVVLAAVVLWVLR